MASEVRLTDGQFDFSGGVDSSKVPLLTSPLNPNGLARNKLAWLVNGTVRGGGIAQRGGWQPLCTVSDGTKLYQGGIMYETEPLGLLNPYLMLAIGGEIFLVRVDSNNAVQPITNQRWNAALPQAFFVQGERFVVIQVGDFVTNPIIWDGAVMSRSVGIISPFNVPGPYPLGQLPFNEIPPGGAMSYYMGRIWYEQPDGRSYAAGDIVGSHASGTAGPYNYTDSILHVTESPLAFGGDGFKLPSQAGNIRAINYPIALDTTLGEGPLFVWTSKQVYALTVPVDRTAWIATTINSQPLQRVVMNQAGAVGERSIVAVNGDLWYQSLDPAIRTFLMALRYFETWGNTPASNPINRILAGNNRALMHLASAMAFNSRMFQGVLPVQTAVGVACQSIAVMDMDPLSTLDDQKPPVWEGSHEGLNWLQFFTGNFGGLERAFGVVQSQVDGSIQVWENSDGFLRDNGDNRITTYIEFPQFDWGGFPRAQGGGPFELKRLDGLDLWVDQVIGTVDFTLQFRVDDDTCLYDWSTKQICAARSSLEDANATATSYPPTPYYQQFKVPLTFGPPVRPPCGVASGRPVNYGYRFQPILTIKGTCRVRAYHIHAIPKATAPFTGQVCSPFFGPVTTATGPAPAPPPPPVFVGYQAKNWAAALAQMVVPPAATCPSTKPAWGGLFTNQIAGVPSGFPNWYFLGQSIGGLKAAGDETPGYPGNDWQDNDCYTELAWDGLIWTFFVFSTCCNSIWIGTSAGASATDPSGLYVVHPSSPSANPASITVAALFQ